MCADELDITVMNRIMFLCPPLFCLDVRQTHYTSRLTASSLRESAASLSTQDSLGQNIIILNKSSSFQRAALPGMEITVCKNVYFLLILPNIHLKNTFPQIVLK